VLVGSVPVVNLVIIYKGGNLVIVILCFKNYNRIAFIKYCNDHIIFIKFHFNFLKYFHLLILIFDIFVNCPESVH